VTEAIIVGNAPLDGARNAGWVLGHFLPEDDPRHSTAVEVKWGVHAAGDRRAEWVRGEERITLAVLVSGRFRLEFPDRVAPLAEPGDYVLWGKGVDHSWEAERDSVVLIVRWPSVPGYRVGAAAAAEDTAEPPAEQGER
jgi:quercetin dioxygenase-like cupin family protein